MLEHDQNMIALNNHLQMTRLRQQKRFVIVQCTFFVCTILFQRICIRLPDILMKQKLLFGVTVQLRVAKLKKALNMYVTLTCYD